MNFRKQAQKIGTGLEGAGATAEMRLHLSAMGKGAKDRGTEAEKGHSE